MKSFICKRELDDTGWKKMKDTEDFEGLEVLNIGEEKGQRERRQE